MELSDDCERMEELLREVGDQLRVTNCLQRRK